MAVVITEPEETREASRLQSCPACSGSVYPQLKDVRIDFEWGGKIGIVLNRMPLLGRINQNVYYSQGYSGHGVNATHTMGELVADAIGGTMERFDIFAETPHYRDTGQPVVW